MECHAHGACVMYVVFLVWCEFVVSVCVYVHRGAWCLFWVCGVPPGARRDFLRDFAAGGCVESRKILALLQIAIVHELPRSLGRASSPHSVVFWISGAPGPTRQRQRYFAACAIYRVH